MVMWGGHGGSGYIYCYSFVVVVRVFILVTCGTRNAQHKEVSIKPTDALVPGIDPSHNLHSASDKYPSMHNFVTETCTYIYTHSYNKLVRCGIWVWWHYGIVAWWDCEFGPLPCTNKQCIQIYIYAYTHE